MKWSSGTTEDTALVSGGSANYQITQLEAGTSYMVTVRASNSAGTSESDAISTATGTAETQLPARAV